MKKIPSKHMTRIFRILAEVVVFILVLSAVVFAWSYASDWVDAQVPRDIGKESIYSLRGVFGDKFGAVNALFSGLAFAGIILTLLLQRRDLAEARRTAGTQQFNDTFFRLLALHIDITAKLSETQLSGRAAFDALNKWLREADQEFVIFSALQKLDKPAIRAMRDSRVVNAVLFPQLDATDVANISISLGTGTAALDNYLDDDMIMHEKQVEVAYTKVAASRIDSFAHYFRNLYHILKYIHESELVTLTEKTHYSRIVRAQLTDVELLGIFYNSLTPIRLPGRPDMELGCPKMNRLLARYDILQNMSPRSMFHPIHMEIFKKNAA